MTKSSLRIGLKGRYASFLDGGRVSVLRSGPQISPRISYETDRADVQHPKRVRKVRAFGIGEASFLSATREHRTIYGTGLIDLDHKRVIDMVNRPGFYGGSLVRSYAAELASLKRR